MTSNCDCNKVCYFDKKAAKLTIKRMKGRRGKLHPYRCGHYWHIGHSPTSLVRGQVSRADLAKAPPRPRPRPLTHRRNR